MTKQHLMASAKALFLLLCMAIFFNTGAEAQIFKKIGEKIEKSVERRVDRKIDKGVEKGLDKVEDGVDQSVKDAASDKPKQNKTKDKPQMITTVDDAPYSAAAAEKAKSHDGLILVSADCGSYAWFKKGAKLQYEVTSTASKENYMSSMEVQDVRHEGRKTIASILSSDQEGNAIEMDFICTGNQLYFDLTGMLKSQLEKQGQSGANVDVSFDGGLMSIPKNIYPGQQLDDAVFTMNMTSSGINMGVTSYLKERKVVGRESLTTPAGTFNCIKISGVRTMTMTMMGKDRVVGKPVTEHMYFAPSIGMIKTTSENHKGQVEYEQTLTKYEL